MVPPDDAPAPSSRTSSFRSGNEGYRFGMPTRTPISSSAATSDLQTDHAAPFDVDEPLRSFRHVFPPLRRASATGRVLQLTRDESERLVALATSLRDDVVAAYDVHTGVHRRQTDSKEWKPVKKRDHLVVVKQKKPTTPPTMMAYGSIAGQLDDLLYGLSSETALEMKLQGSYSSSSLLDAAVLAAIDTPTLEAPFQFLGIKWVLQSFGSGSTASSSAKTLMKKRDLMYLESIGMTALPSGERIGYRVLHSVNFKSMAHLSDSAVRAKISMCQLFRQRSDGKTIDVFMRGYYDPSGGRVSQMLATSVSADMMLQAPGDALECANLKKLAWCAKQSGRRRRKMTFFQRQNRTASGADPDEMRLAAQEQESESASSSTCIVCHRDCGRMLRRSASACMVCSQLVCSRCSVVKKLSFAMGPSLSSDVMGQHQPLGAQEDDSQEIRQKALSFCLHCIVVSNRERAFDVAVSELEERGVGLAKAPSSAPVRAPMSSTHSRATPMSAHSRARQSSLRGDDRYSQFLPTPQAAPRRRATTTSGKRMSTVLTANGLTPNEGGVPTRPTKAFSVVSVPTDSSGHDSEELD